MRDRFGLAMCPPRTAMELAGDPFTAAEQVQRDEYREHGKGVFVKTRYTRRVDHRDQHSAEDQQDEHHKQQHIQQPLPAQAQFAPLQLLYQRGDQGAVQPQMHRQGGDRCQPKPDV